MTPNRAEWMLAARLRMGSTEFPPGVRIDRAGNTPGMAGGYVSSGGYSRDQRYITTRITADGRDGYPVQAGRYRLVVSRACPWANRSIIVRRLLGLEDALS